MNTLPYDKTSPISIEAYAKNLIEHTFLDVVDGNFYDAPKLGDYQTKSEISNSSKGKLGNIIEEFYFGYKPNSSSEPDFPDAEVELKVSPFETTKEGKIRAGERLVLSMINYSSPIEASLFGSHLWAKCKLLLLIYYWRDKSITDNLLYPIRYVSLFTPPPEDLAIIENDYKIITDKIISGKAEELSESDTFYLGACTKGATAEKSIVKQFYPPHTPAKKRAFCYKNSYMTYVLNQYIVTGTDTYESIVDDVSELDNKNFGEFVVQKINAFKGKTDKELCAMFNRPYNNNKAQWTDLAYRMLGIKSNKAAEFRKANISVKEIRVEENGKIRENMSFAPFKYMDIIQEEWDDSTLHNYFDETKFLFVVFRHNGDCYELQGSQLWNMPYDDLNTEVKAGWEKVVNKIKEGIKLDVVHHKNGSIVKNNLPKKSDNRIVHVRPHARKSYFKFNDGTVIGNGKPSDANPLPDGTMMTHYSFWINNDYILEQLTCYEK